MFEDWKQAWRDAVDNFRRELDEIDAGGDGQTRSMQRQYGAVREVLERLDIEVGRARRRAEEERENERVCRRREEMARRIDDQETVRIAIEFAARHSERAGVLERKVEVFLEERALLVRDLDEMKAALEDHGVKAGIETGRTGSIADVDREREKEKEKENRDFGRLEQIEKERAAAERLEELKRRMR